MTPEQPVSFQRRYATNALATRSLSVRCRVVSAPRGASAPRSSGQWSRYGPSCGSTPYRVAIFDRSRSFAPAGPVCQDSRLVARLLVLTHGARRKYQSWFPSSRPMTLFFEDRGGKNLCFPSGNETSLISASMSTGWRGWPTMCSHHFPGGRVTQSDSRWFK